MRRRFIIVFGMILMLSGWSGTLGAQEDPVQEDPKVVMDTVVVTASRQEEPTARVPAHVTVITAEDIENSTAQNVAEVLGALGGVHITDLSGNKRNYTVDLRGFGESAQQNILLLVDGRRINLPDLSGPDWNLIPIDRIERIEIIRGSRGSVLYGDNANGGVINIITKEGSRLEGNVNTAYGSFNTFNAGGSVSGAGSIASFDITANFSNSDGYRDNSESDSKDVGANLRLDPTDFIQLHLSTGYHYDDTNNPGALLQSDFDAGAERTDTRYPDDYDKVRDYYVKAGLELDMLTNDSFILETAFRNREKDSYGSYVGGWFDSDTKTNIYSLSPQLIFREDFEGITNKVILGLDYTNSDQEYDSQSEYYTSLSQIDATLKKENTAFFIHNDLGIGKHLSLSGGYRLDRVTFKYDPADTRERNMDEDAYNAAINYAFHPKAHLYASYTHSFRYPVLDEQFTYSTSTVNTDVQAQTSNNYEMGGSFEIVSDLELHLNIFRMETDNEIFFNALSYANENMEGVAIRQGGELKLSFARDELNMSSSYILTDTVFEDGPYDGNQVPNVPHDRVTLRANYTLPFGLSLGAEALYVGERFMISDFENDFDKAKAYTVVNATLRYEWRWLAFFADFNNIFNEEYSAYNGIQFNLTTFESEPGYYPSPEFNVLVGVSARFNVL